METAIFKLKPHPVIKPWGLLHRSVKDITGVSVGVGELWHASAQTGEGNEASGLDAGTGYGDLAQLLESADGESELERFLGPTATRTVRNVSCRGKTEAWLVRESRGFTGFTAGPPDEEGKERLKQLLNGPGLSPDVNEWSEDVRNAFGFVTPVHSGESFLVPAGTLHTMFAHGRGSRLIVDEIQQGYGSGLLPTLFKTLMVEDDILSVQVHPDDATVSRASRGELQIAQDLQANPTIRVYDFGRRPGEHLEAGFEVADAGAGLRRIRQVGVDLPGCELVVTVASEQFVMTRLRLRRGAEVDSLPVFGSYRVMHCTAGEIMLQANGRRCRLSGGETALVPGELEPSLVVATRSGGEVLDHAVPDTAVLRRWCKKHGAGASNLLEGLLNPSRA